MGIRKEMLLLPTCDICNGRYLNEGLMREYSLRQLESIRYILDDSKIYIGGRAMTFEQSVQAIMGADVLFLDMDGMLIRGDTEIADVVKQSVDIYAPEKFLAGLKQLGIRWVDDFYCKELEFTFDDGESYAKSPLIGVIKLAQASGQLGLDIVERAALEVTCETMLTDLANINPELNYNNIDTLDSCIYEWSDIYCRKLNLYGRVYENIQNMPENAKIAERVEKMMRQTLTI
ncbi:hypothetical protein [Treponema sp. R6D11]